MAISAEYFPETTADSIDLTPEQFLEQFRPYALANNKAASGDPSASHAPTFDAFMIEARDVLDERIPDVAETTTSQSHTVEKISAFSDAFLTSARFIGLVAIRRAKKQPEFERLIEERDLRLGVLACLGQDTIATGKILSPKPDDIAPATWKAVKAHFRGPKEIIRLVNRYPDLTKSLIIRTLITKPMDADSRLEEIRSTIAVLQEDFPDLSPGQVNQAIVRRPTDPRSLLEQLQERKKANPKLKTHDGLRVGEIDPKGTELILASLKADARFADQDIPEYIFNRASHKKRQTPSEYLEWFIETRDELMEDFGEYGIGLVHHAVAEHPSNPREFCEKFVKNIALLSEDPNYSFLSKRERYQYAMVNPDNLEDALKPKVQAYKQILAEPRYLEELGLGSIKRAIRNSDTPERTIRRIYLRKKYAYLGLDVVDYSLGDNYPDLTSSESLIKKYSTNYMSASRTKRFAKIPKEDIRRVCLEEDEPQTVLQQLWLSTEDGQMYQRNLILLEDEKYAFLDKETRDKLAEKHLHNLELVLAKKSQVYLQLSSHPIYSQFIGPRTIKNVVRTSDDPEKRLRAIYLRRKFKSLPGSVIEMAVEGQPDLHHSQKLLRRITKNQSIVKKIFRIRKLPNDLVDDYCIRYENPLILLNKLIGLVDSDNPGKLPADGRVATEPGQNRINDQMQLVHLSPYFQKAKAIRANPETSFLSEEEAIAILLSSNPADALRGRVSSFKALRNDFPDIDESILVFASRNFTNPREFIEEANKQISDLELNAHPIVKRYGNAFLVTALTYHSDNPLKFLEEAEELRKELLAGPHSIFGERLIAITILRGLSGTSRRLSELEHEVNRRFTDPNFKQYSTYDIRQMTAEDYLAGKINL